MAAGLAEQHAHQIFDEKALERPCSKGCHERLIIHFLKRLEHVPVAKSDAKNAFFASDLATGTCSRRFRKWMISLSWQPFEHGRSSAFSSKI